MEVYRAETQRLADQLAVAVVACIEAGATWGEVGRRLGISKQAARAHWARYLDQDQPRPDGTSQNRNDQRRAGRLS